MKIVQSFWSKPYLQNMDGRNVYDRGKAGFLSNNLFLATHALSVLNLRKYFDEVVLVTDDYGKRLLVDYLNLPYTKVSTELNELQGYHTDLWALGKIKAYSLQKEPFIHVDGDVFLWKPPNTSILNAPLICEHVNAVGNDFSDFIETTYKSLDYIPANLLSYQAEVDTPGMINTGVFGGNDVSFIKDFAGKAFDFVDNNLNKLPDIDTKRFNRIYEQYLLSCLAHYHKQPVTKWLNQEISETAVELTNFFMLPEKVAYTHLRSSFKKQLISMEQVVLRLKLEHPEYYTYFSKLFGKEIFDINLKLALSKT